MKKHSFGKAISVVTSLVLVISILLSMSLTALATTTEIYGTEAGGIENTDVRTLAAVDGTANHNLDFSKGLQYWGFAAGGRSITSYATLKTIDGTNNQYVEFNKSVNDFATVPFSIDANEGDQIGIAFDYIGTGNFSLELWQVASDGNKYKCGVSQTGSKFAAGESVNNGWDTYFTSYIQNAVVADDTNDGKAVFYVKINFTVEEGKTAAVDNFRVLKQTGDDEFTVLDTNEKYSSSGKPATGSVAEGIVNKDVRTVGITEGIANPDFAKGLKYWGFANTYSGSILSYATLKTIEGTNNQYVEFNKSVYDFATVPFSVEAAKDEKIGIAFDYIGTGNFSLELWQVASDGNKYKCGVSQTGSKFAAGESVNNGWDTYFTSYIQNAVVADDTNDGKAVFYVKINFTVEEGKTAAVDNFRVLKQTGDDEFTVLDTNEKYNSSGKPATGSVAEGITNTDVRNVAATNGTSVHNLDFSKGLKYWGFAAGSRSITSYATLKTIDGTNNQYVEFNKSVNDFATVPFSIDANEGDQIGIAFDYIGTGNFSLELWQVASDGNKYKCGVSQTGSKFAAGESVNNGWDTYFTSYIQNAVVADGTEDGKATFYAKINFELEAGQTAAVDNFRVIKQTGGDEFTVLDTNEKYNSSGKPATGTVAEGIVSKDVKNILATNGTSVHNLDFSKGLKYWGFANTYGGSILSYATLKTIEGTNNQYVEFNKSVNDFATVPFTISANAGDYIGVLFDSLGTGSASLEIWQVTNDGYSFMCGSDTGNANALKLASGEATNSGWTAYYTKAQNVVVDDGSDDGKVTFYIKINFTAGNGQTVAVDNFRLIKQNADSSFTTLDTNESYSPNGKPPYGTFEGGIEDNTNTLAGMSPLDELTNADFAEGLKYWGGVETTTPASIATIKTENENNYVNIKTTSGSWQGIASVPFKISGVKAGDYVGIRLKYRTNNGSGTGICIGLAQNGYDYSKLKSCTEYQNVTATGSEWKTLVTNDGYNGAKLVAVEDDGWFAVRISAFGAALDIDIDDIEIVKFDDNEGKLYTTLDGIRCNYEGLPIYGTAQDGIVLNDVNNKVADLPLIEGFDNFDFSNGLINFGPKAPNGGYWKKLSDIGITAENGMMKIDYTANTSQYDSYIGFRSVDVKIPEGLVGKKLYVNLDVATLKGLNIRVLVDGEGTWGNINGDVGDITTKTLLNYTSLGNGTVVPEGASTVAVELEAPNTADALALIDNIKLVYADIGGMDDKFANLDGSVVGDWEMGDANADNTVNILDLVRMKKYSADPENVKIYYAAAKMSSENDTFGASDLVALSEKLLTSDTVSEKIDTTRYYDYANYNNSGLYNLANGNNPVLTTENVSWKSNLTVPGDSYSISVTPSGTNAPIISELTSQVDADESITVMGEGYTTNNTKAYYLDKNGISKEAQFIVVNDTQMEVTIDSNEAYGAYGVYVVNDNGTSNVKLVNTPKIWWIGLTEVTAGDTLEIYGENLTTNNGTESNVYLLDGNQYHKMKVISANSYKVIVQIPAGLTSNKTYDIKLHNGHGGEYAWAKAPEQITFMTTLNSSGKTITVNGNNSEAVVAAIESASNGDTIYFPAGTYTLTTGISVNKELTFEGAGANTTKIVVANDAVGVSEAMFFVTKKCEFANLAFEDIRTDAFDLSFIRYNQDGNYNYNYEVSASENLYIHNCKFLHSTVPEAKSDIPAILISESSSVVIENNYFEVTQVLTARNMSKLFVRNNEICGVSYCDENDNHNSFLIWNTNMMDISGNKLYGKDYLTDKSGEIIKGDQTIGRSFCIQQGSRKAYISENEMKHVGLYGNNSGEQILLEDVANLYLGGINSATEKTVTVKSDIATSSNNLYTEIHKNSIVMIVKGKGVGQYRTISSYNSSNREVTVNENWTITPDTTSEIMIFNGFSDFVIYNNTVDGFKNHNEAYTAACGAAIYGNSVNCFVKGNKFSNVGYGIYITSHYNANQNSSGVYWTQCDENIIENVSVGIKYNTEGMVSSDPTEIPMHLTLGITIRGNKFNNMLNFLYDTKHNLGGLAMEVGTRDHIFLNQPATKTWDGAWQNGSLIENNEMTNCDIFNILLCKHQGNTILRGNIATGDVYNSEVGNGFTTIEPIIYN